MSTTNSKPAPVGSMTYEEFLDWADEDTLLDIIGKPYADYRREQMRKRGV